MVVGEMSGLAEEDGSIGSGEASDDVVEMVVGFSDAGTSRSTGRALVTELFRVGSFDWLPWTKWEPLGYADALI